MWPPRPERALRNDESREAIKKYKNQPLWPLCHACAVALGGRPTDRAVTCMQQTCVKCGKKAPICAYSDYSWPNGDKAIWD